VILLSDLSDREQRTYLRCLAAVAQVDTVFDEAEVNLFMVVAQSMGIPTQQTHILLEQEPIQVAEVPGVRTEVAELIVKDMAAMAVCDRDLLEVEAEMIRHMGLALGSTPAQVDHVLNCCQKVFVESTSGSLI